MSIKFILGDIVNFDFEKDRTLDLLNEDINIELLSSFAENLKFFAIKFINPLYVNESMVSLSEKSIFLYPSLLNAKTAFGPTSLSPLTSLQC